MQAVNEAPSGQEEDSLQRRRLRDSGLAALAVVLQLRGQGCSAAALRHLAGTQDAVAAPLLVRLAQHQRCRARQVNSAAARLPVLALPALAQLRDGSYLVLLKHRDGEVLLHDAIGLRTFSLALARFSEIWSGMVILVAPPASGPGERQGLAWFLPALHKYRRQLGEVLLASAFLQLLALVTPLVTQVVIDKVLVHRSLQTLDVLVAGLVLANLFDSLLAGLRAYVFSHTTNRIDVELGARLFGHLLDLPLAYFESRKAGDSVARVRELENIRNFLTGNVLTVVIDLVFALVFFGVMLLYSPVLTLVVAGSLPLYVALSVVFTPVLRRRLDDKFARGAESQAFLVEAINGVETVKAMAAEPEMQRRWEQLLGEYVQAAFRAGNLASVAGQAVATVGKLNAALLLWIGARLAIGGSLSIGELIAFTMYAGRVSAPVLRLAQLWQDCQQVGLSIARLGDILENRRETLPLAQSEQPALTGVVRFDQVTFRYRVDGPAVLQSLSLEVPAGQVVGIVGASGAGKSTLAKLMLRLHVPSQGRVLIDGLDAAALAPASIRRQIGVVLQENGLFSGTVRENIAFSQRGLPFEEVVAAARLAGAHDFIVGLPQGYDTALGERGLGLSGGQRQRLAIARALARHPRILVFDEATSALDVESEAILHQHMPAICAGRTVFIIAHRLAAVMRADRILVMEQGAIAEQGSHAELLRANGRYASMWAHQARCYHGD